MRPDLVPRPRRPLAVVSPSYTAAGAFRHMQEASMRRLRDESSLVPVEYRTIRQVGASPRKRARDLTAALAGSDTTHLLNWLGGSA